ncbi:hypothetical protein QJS04_geneDACA005080 [Acorus gramineus]|uniref:INO80 complex subunit B-like conserved region domain-containing protein n=1 Tax=Acorus gramineus TaxID=55184 RepID=A0AAV9AWL4_ACOGR|nr:hypothetical protein QJS04_geneDACA005080 [Acorus gramineus]
MHNAKGITNVALEVGKGSDWRNINRQIFGQSQVDVCSNSLGVSNGLSDKVVINDFSEADPKPGHQTHGLLTQEIGVTKDNSKNGCVHTAREKITPTIPSIQNRSTRKNSRKKPYKEQAIQKITKKAVVKIQAFEPVCSSTGVLKRRIHGNDCNKSDFCHNHQSHKKRKSHDAHNEGYKDAPLRRSSRFLKIGLVEDTQNSDLGLVVKSETCPKHELVGPSVSEKSYALECHHAFHPLTEADSKAASKDLFHGQKQKLPDLEGQLKKLEAAQRHRMKVEMAAREIQAAVIKKILGQGSNREKRFHQGQTQMEQDKARKPLQSNTIRWVMGPTGTIVSFSEESELQRLFVPSTCRYPLPRERCAGPTCTNTYKYRDSKSNLPLCSLQCYQAVNEGIQPVTTC